jgi:hypothetical protein
MPVAGVIIAALIAGGASLAAAGMSASEQEKAREEEKGLALIKREDVLKQQAASDALTRAQMAQSERMGLQSLAFNREEAQMGRAERTEEKSYSRKKENYANALALLNNNLAMQDRMAKYWS